MAKRVSVKGKGADIFFGDYQPTPPKAAPSSDSPNNGILSPTREDQSTTEERKQDNLQESKNARMRARKQEILPHEETSTTPFAPDVINSVWQYVAERATLTNAFRYTDQELSSLTDVIYEITKRHGVKLTKQDVARLGLNIILWDYRLRGDASLLSQFVTKKKPQHD